MQDAIQELDIEAIQPSPFNPRKHVGDVAELAESMMRQGQLQPVVVRPAPEGAPEGITHELVFGHRRHRAAAVAGLQKIRAVVSEYSDDQVLEIQIVENSQRVDVHPLDEADGFQALVDRGRSMKEIADAIGRSAPYVSQRLQLRQLTEAGRDALERGLLSLGAALALARVPDALQDKALEELIEDTGVDWSESGYERDGEERPTVAAVSGDYARKFLARQFMRTLEDAPFALDDAELVPAAGACSSCPKRTGAQAALFSDLAASDLCTDGACFRAKADARWAQMREDEALVTLDEEESVSALQRYGRGPWAALTRTVYIRKVDPDDGGLERHVPTPISEVIKDFQLPVALARDPDSGAIVTVVDAKEVDSIVDELNGVSPDDHESAMERAAKQKAEQRKAKDRANRLAREVDLCIEAAVEACTGEFDAALTSPLNIAARLALDAFWHDSQVAVLRRRGVDIPKNAGGYGQDTVGALQRHYDSMDPAGRIGLLLELALRRRAPVSGSGSTAQPPEWTSAMKELGVDVAAIRKQVTAEFRKKPAAKKPAKSKAKAESETA